MARQNRRGPAAQDDRRAPTFNNAVERWIHGLVKEQTQGLLATGEALLRGAEALQALQADAQTHAMARRGSAREQAGDARSVPELAAAQMLLLQQDAEAALQLATQAGETLARTGLEALNEAFESALRLNGELWSFAQHWLDALGSAQDAEALEAQVEHTLNPLASGLWGWPAQEATREAVNFVRLWTDWPAAATGLAAAAAPSAPRADTLH